MIKSNTPALITKSYDGKAFVFRADGYFNMTKAAKEYGKDVHEFIRLPSTQEYMGALGQTGKIPECYEAIRGGRTPGTWGHPKLAVFFARWLDVRFSVWCDTVIDDILKGYAQLTITSPQAEVLKLKGQTPDFGVCFYEAL